jgi:hypothetical protein
VKKKKTIKSLLRNLKKITKNLLNPLRNLPKEKMLKMALTRKEK